MLTNFGEQFASIGVQLGARYDGSPIIAADDAAPSDSFITYTPTSVPGGRAPHVWLDQGRGTGSSLFDRLGRGFTLLRLGFKAPSASALANAAARARIPFKMLDCPDSEVRDLYGCDLALIRPDQHVAWRGNADAADADRLFARTVGAEEQ
jgi:Aromatic-ring hydroxylase, C-terminal